MATAKKPAAKKPAAKKPAVKKAVKKPAAKKPAAKKAAKKPAAKPLRFGNGLFRSGIRGQCDKRPRHRIDHSVGTNLSST